MAKPEIQSMIFASSQSTQRDNVRASTIFIHLLKSGTGKAVISLMTSNKLLIKIILVLLILWLRYHMKITCAFKCYVKWALDTNFPTKNVLSRLEFNVKWKFLVHKGLQIQLTHLLNYFDVK